MDGERELKRYEEKSSNFRENLTILFVVISAYFQLVEAYK